jgi:KaiC/GvpD/RAD55 family RecA-like ATPase
MGVAPDDYDVPHPADSEPRLRVATQNRKRGEPLPAEETSHPKSVGISPADIVERWKTEGPLVRIPTGIAPLDELCLGGLPVPWRAIIVGGPSAGKTAVEVAIAKTLAASAARAGLYVGILAVDEEPDDVTIRLAQMAGFTIAQAERRDPAELTDMADALRPLRLKLYDSDDTIEMAARHLGALAAAEGRKAALFIDSLQTVTSESGAGCTTPRELVEANVRAMRWAHDALGLLVVATSEANRAAYRDDDAAETTNDLAAGAESRSIEFGAKTQLMLRTPKEHPDTVWVRVAKNRRAKRGEFWLQLDRESHTLSPCENPKGSPASADKNQQAKRSANLEKVEADARTLLKLLLRSPGQSERGLRAIVKADGLEFGVERFNAARVRLCAGVDGYRAVNRGTTTACKWFVEAEVSP